MSWFNMAMNYFESNPEPTVPMFDLKKYALDLFAASNAGVDVDMTIVERNLSNNQDYSEMLAKKLTWQTEEDPSPIIYPADYEPNSIVALQPQRIRLFRVEYAPKQQTKELAEPELIMN